MGVFIKEFYMARILLIALLHFSITCGMEKLQELRPIPPIPTTRIRDLYAPQKPTIIQRVIANENCVFDNFTIDYEQVYRYPIIHVMKKYMADYHVPEDQAAITEVSFKTFIINAAQVKFPSRMKDRATANLWHTFVLFSRDYYVFCFKCFGRMIHHEPAICDMLSHSGIHNNTPCDSGMYID
jgi:hypothetical protein